ncbi:ATPase [Pseudomonas nitroreducens]|uniref:ATPase n=1 Tax=Pseudomonas nitroreducens TaxID=46680 RepID=A0A246F805_PSENT|nr:ATPase [Pseudomonas nitroreducens]OWP49776.1 ATPase [Pseudomonas nitroreducens]
MTNSTTPAAEGQTNKSDPVILAHHEAQQMYFCPQTEELIFLADSEAGPFEQHWRDMLTRMDEYHQANGEYSSALEHYAQAYTQGNQPATELDKRLKAVDAAEQALQTKRDKLLEKLDKFSTEDMTYKDVVELLPIGDTRARYKSGSVKVKGATGRRYVYVKKKIFDDALEKKKLHPVALNGKKKGQGKSAGQKNKQQDLPKGGEESIYVTNSAGKSRIDKDKLAKQIKSLNLKEIKLELGDAARWFGLEKQLDWLERDASLFEWADTWNASPYIDVSAGAQFLRYAHNLGASVEFNPEKGQFAIKGEAKGSLTLASGFASFATYAPDRLGWSLAYQSNTGEKLDMGLLRLCLEGQVTGFIGASAQLEGQLQVVRQGDTQLIAGQPGGRLPRFRERQLKSKKPFHQRMDAQDEGLQVSGEVFVGAKAEGALKGSVQWMKPTPPAEIEAKLPGILQGGKNSGEFVDFCSISGSIAGLAGAGAGLTFHCTFLNGKFCFHFAASLCWGLGAKGGMVAEVGAANIVEFGAWLIYQLYQLDYSFLEIVAKEAFNTYSRYCLLRFQRSADEMYEIYKEAGDQVVDISRIFLKFIESLESQNRKDFEASKRRNELASSVVSRQQDLLRYTPEAKGILLYLLTRHGVWDHLDTENRGSGWVPDLYQERKEAVICVLRSIQTRSEWSKVLCRMTRDGSSLAQGGNEATVVAGQRQQLVDFLQEGFNRDTDLYKAERELAAIYDRIRTEVAWGYALAMNDSMYYQLNTGVNPNYPQRCTFGPCEAEGPRTA